MIFHIVRKSKGKVGAEPLLLVVGRKYLASDAVDSPEAFALDTSLGLAAISKTNTLLIFKYFRAEKSYIAPALKTL